MGRFDDSIENYKKALEIQPDFHYSYLGIASNLVYLNKPSDARAELENFLSQTQDEGQRREAYFAIAVTYVYEGDFANAIQSIKQQFGMASQGQDITAMAYDQNILGKLQYETGQYDEALASFAEARRVIHSSDLSMSLKQLADRNLLYNETYVALKRGDMESAKAKTDLYREAAVKTGDPNQIRKSYELRGMLALAESNFTEAIENFELGNLENAYSLYHLALAYQGNTDLSKALEYSKKTADFNGLIDLNYALVRTKARLLAEKLSAQLNS
jgi:tetratricopeptide (TPR) repeat protein